MFARMITSFGRMCILTFCNLEPAATKEQVTSSMDSKMNWIRITHGPFTELSPASLTCSFLGLIGPVGSVFNDYLMSLEGKCLQFSPDQNKGIFLKE